MSFAFLHTGKIYNPYSPGLGEAQGKRLRLLASYNSLDPSDLEARRAALEEMFLSFGEGSMMPIPLYANWAGLNVMVGRNFRALSGLVLVDDSFITIGDDCSFGSNVVISTGTHPVSPGLRLKTACYNLPVTIGNNVVVGDRAVILPGSVVPDGTAVAPGEVWTRRG